ncbi:hypothetical protein Y032_0007g3406 [Ancylostoma ceylanicum]|uniref:Uncharacterized protein n=1 Tax=Ancylostoma ceylanicum TaxID=53326 RepID=A0A016VMW1_9BILA|nr:hypothetical protein Y032_0007g3406 [Ancylostoma ceylanicum]
MRQREDSEGTSKSLKAQDVIIQFTHVDLTSLAFWCLYLSLEFKMFPSEKKNKTSDKLIITLSGNFEYFEEFNPEYNTVDNLWKKDEKDAKARLLRLFAITQFNAEITAYMCIFLESAHRDL